LILRFLIWWLGTTFEVEEIGDSGEAKEVDREEGRERERSELSSETILLAIVSGTGF
jgi:hypothetical protein